MLLKDTNSLGKFTSGSNELFKNVKSDVQKVDTLYQAKGGKKYSVRIRSDTSICDIVSACTLEDGTMILADHNNNALNRLNGSTFAVIDHIDINGRPWQVCPISMQEAAVCLRDALGVQFLSVSNKMTLSRKISTDFECFGLVNYAGFLYISDKRTSVHVYDMAGQELMKYEFGKELFSFIRSLSVNKNGSKIYVGNHKCGMVVLNKNGSVAKELDGVHLDAYGSYRSFRGTLLVCSKNVLQFGPEGDLVGEVLAFDDKTASCGAICCNLQMTKMVIGKNRDEVEVFDLQKSVRRVD
jgi:hypothetical protein